MECLEILGVIDCQNDFIDGVLGTNEARLAIPHIVNRIAEHKKQVDTDEATICKTYDTHFDDTYEVEEMRYHNTQEGRKLEVGHCYKNTDGWQIYQQIEDTIGKKFMAFEKYTFGSVDFANHILGLYKKYNGKIKVVLIGFCTDICVISNALLLKAFMPELEIIVNSKCCAGVTPESHKAALETMKMCQITVI